MAEPNVDLSEFVKLSKPKRRPCAIATALTQLKPAAAAELKAAVALDQGIITNAAIEQWLGARGIQTTSQAVSSHRKATCTCHDA